MNMNPYGRPKVPVDEKCENLTVRIPVKLKKQVNFYAAKNGDKVSAFVRKAIDEYIKRHKDLWENLDPILDALEKHRKQQ